jgi:hypothetical protein
MQAYLIKITLFILFTINQLMAQSFQFNDIQPSTAQKWGRENGRNIFVLIENKFYPNSLKIEKEILPQQEVKDILYSKFICLKLDANDMNGSDFIKKYALNEEIAFVFMGTNDNILYKESKKVTIDEFVEMAERAIELAKEADPSKLYESEFKNGRNDVEFLEKYLNFLIDKRQDCTEVIIKYFKSISEDEYFKSKNILYLINGRYDDAIGSFIFGIVSKAKEMDTPHKKQLKSKYTSMVYQSIEFAANINNEKLYLEVDSLLRTLEIPETHKYNEFFRKCRFYGTTKDTAKIKNYLLDFIKNEVWQYSKIFLENKNAQSKKANLKEDETYIRVLNQKDNHSRVNSFKMNPSLASDMLYEAVIVTLLAFRNDKMMLNKGLEWIEMSQKIKDFHDENLIVNHSKLLYLNGFREKAITELGKLIDNYKNNNSTNEFVIQRMSDLNKLMSKMIKNEEI